MLERGMNEVLGRSKRGLVTSVSVLQVSVRQARSCSMVIEICLAVGYYFYR